MVRVSKEAVSLSQNETVAADLEKINSFTRRELTKDEVFTFSVILCDNEVDRDCECFTTESLRTLSELFVGKTGITDHKWSSDGQIARIYDAELVEDEVKTTSYGEKYAYVKAYAYAMKTEGNEEFIAQIEGGIKKEVSVGCAVSDKICSICGQPIGSNVCGHIPGTQYGGVMCFAKLTDPTDAYEWSFVAVPAQKGAGVIKKFGIGAGSLKELAEKSGNAEIKAQLAELETMANLGRQYMKDIRKDVVRLGILTDIWDGESLKKTVEKLDACELLSLKSSLEKKADELLPPVTQLNPFRENKPHAPETEYMV